MLPVSAPGISLPVTAATCLLTARPCGEFWEPSCQQSPHTSLDGGWWGVLTSPSHDCGVGSVQPPQVMGDGQDMRRPGHRMNLLLRGLLLFLIGVFLALVLNLLQVQRNVTLFPPDVLSSLLSSAWWVPLCCGTAAAAIGLLYPCIDRQLGKPHRFKREWSSVMRCVAVFVGINHASAKVDFANNLQLSLTLAALSIGLWWTFDRSRSGLGLGVCIAFFATLVSQLLVYNGVYHMSGNL
ncbi:insulin-induced gene 2 protein isoform X3 [Ranitomeya variabilis]|uniref:insulin-induced gene 2 protein isoform X3 n=2 Tax=Ranitomeya variabilis TaxID=490064 RepID=UPI0040560C54